MGISERREKEKQEMRTAILDAAMNLFIREGYESVSIRKIAEKIEYSPSTIYLYFEDKDAIFFELHNIGFSLLYNCQLKVQSIADPKERLLAHGRAYLQFAMENQEYYDIMFIVRSPGKVISHFDAWECGDRTYDLLMKNVQDCFEIGLFKDQELESVAFLLWSAMHGMASLLIRKRIILPVPLSSEPPHIFAQAMSVLRSLIK